MLRWRCLEGQSEEYSWEQRADWRSAVLLDLLTTKKIQMLVDYYCSCILAKMRDDDPFWRKENRKRSTNRQLMYLSAASFFVPQVRRYNAQVSYISFFCLYVVFLYIFVHYLYKYRYKDMGEIADHFRMVIMSQQSLLTLDVSLELR